MKTFSGKEAPIGSGGEVNLVDLVMGQARARRFGGIGDPEWTVQHHVALGSLVWMMAGYPLDELCHWVVHDAAEAYLTDIPGPVKVRLREIGSAGGNKIDPLHLLERDVDLRIRTHLGLPAPSEEAVRRVKAVDMACCIVEGRVFGGPKCDCTVDVKRSMLTEVHFVLGTFDPRAAQDLLFRAAGREAAKEAVAAEVLTSGEPPRTPKELSLGELAVEHAVAIYEDGENVTVVGIVKRMKLKNTVRFHQLVRQALVVAGWGEKKLKSGEDVFTPPKVG